MSFFHTDDSTFCGEDQTSAWSETAGIEHAALAFDCTTADPIMSQYPDWVFAGSFDELPDINVGPGPLDDLESADAWAFDSDPTHSSNFQDNYHHTNTDVVAPSQVPTPALTDSDTIASSPVDPSWDGYTIAPDQLMAKPRMGPFAHDPAPAATLSSNELAWLSEQPNQFPSLVPSYTDGDGGVVGSYSPCFNFAGTVSTTPWGSAQIDAPPLCVAHPSQLIPPAGFMLESTRPILGKRPHREDETMGDYIQAVHNSTHGPPRRAKRKMVVNRVSEAVGSTSRVHQKSATRTLEGYHRISEAAGRGAGRLAAPNAHEVYHEFLPGPSVQQELVVTTAQGELPWIEGSEEEATLNHINSVVPQQDIVNSANDGERANVEGGRLQIPKRLSARQMGLLEATPDDWARGTVRALKCRLCPRAAFNGWEGYRRHCDVNEAHPVKLSFCNFCGDFFARTDALARHRTSRPDECREAKKDEAKAKRMATEQLHKEFEGQLVCYLETNKAIGEPFSQRVKAMFPKSSKRGSRQQNRLNRRRA